MTTMTYAQRNSLILGGLLAVLLLTGFYHTEIRQRDLLARLTSREARLIEELSRKAEIVSSYDAVREELDQLETRWHSERQVIPAEDSPAKTLSYLYALQAQAHAQVPFDFHYAGRKDGQGYGANRYELTGKASFEDLYTFLWQIEHGRRFYMVDHLQIVYNEPDTAVYTKDWARVDFRVSLQSAFDPESRIRDGRTPAGRGEPSPLAGNPFAPMITRSLPENRAGLPDVDHLRLVAVAHDVAFLANSRSAAQAGMRAMRAGDRVHLGRLSRIDIANNRVVFDLNKGGIFERRTLEVSMKETAW